MPKGAVRLRRQQADPPSLVSSMDISWSCSAMKKREIEVCGTTDRHTTLCVGSRLPSVVCWGDKKAASWVSSSNWRFLTWGSSGPLRGDTGAGPFRGVWKQGHKPRNLCSWLLHLCPDTNSPEWGTKWGGDLQSEFFLHMQFAAAKNINIWSPRA